MASRTLTVADSVTERQRNRFRKPDHDLEDPWPFRRVLQVEATPHAISPRITSFRAVRAAQTTPPERHGALRELPQPRDGSGTARATRTRADNTTRDLPPSERHWGASPQTAYLQPGVS